MPSALPVDSFVPTHDVGSDILDIMKRNQGFTVIEIVIVIAFLGLASVLLLSQRADLIATHQDEQRKTAINAIYYSLEEVFYAQNGYYPTNIDDSTLKSIDPAMLKDPNGILINEPKSDYRYEASNCENDKCKQYSLRSSLQREADFVKTSRPDNTK
ncbi:MAG: type II secretion system protein [Candidatus Saccharimonadales bacterium]